MSPDANPQPPAKSLVGQIVGERFQLRARLGQGAQGVTYLAFDQQQNGNCAVKVIRPELLTSDDIRLRLQESIAAARTVDHPAMVGIRDAGDAGADGEWGFYVASDMVTGQSLARFLSKHHTIDAAMAADLSVQLLQLLTQAEEAGVSHGDIKPSNLIVEFRGETPVAHLTDFGLAAPIRNDGMLTPHPYLAPEVARGDADVGPATDIYGVAALTYHAITGQPPYGDVDGTDLLTAYDNEISPARESVQELPPSFDAALLKALAVEPGERYESAQEFLADLMASLGEESDGSYQAPASEAPRHHAPAEGVNKVVPEKEPKFGPGAHPAPEAAPTEDEAPADTPAEGALDLTGLVLDGIYELRQCLFGDAWTADYLAADDMGNDCIAVVFRPTPGQADQVAQAIEANLQLAQEHTHDRLHAPLTTGRTTDDTFFIIYPLPPGDNLREALAQHGVLPAPVAVPIAGQVIEILGSMHAAGKAHGGLCSVRVWIDVQDQQPQAHSYGAGMAAVADMARGKALRQMPRANLSPYALRYRPPEQLRGELQPRSDTYSIAALTFEMLVGQTPFEDDDPARLIDLIEMHTPPSMRQVRPDIRLPTELNLSLARALGKRPEERHHDAGELASELLQGLSSRVPAAPSAASPRPAAPAPEAAPAAPEAPQEATPAEPVGAVADARPSSHVSGEAVAANLDTPRSAKQPISDRRRTTRTALPAGRRRRSKLPTFILLLILAGAGGAAYYFMVFKPNQEFNAKAKKAKDLAGRPDREARAKAEKLYEELIAKRPNHPEVEDIGVLLRFQSAVSTARRSLEPNSGIAYAQGLAALDEVEDRIRNEEERQEWTELRHEVLSAQATQQVLASDDPTTVLGLGREADAKELALSEEAWAKVNQYRFNAGLAALQKAAQAGQDKEVEAIVARLRELPVNQDERLQQAARNAAGVLMQKHLEKLQQKVDGGEYIRAWKQFEQARRWAKAADQQAALGDWADRLREPVSTEASQSAYRAIAMGKLQSARELVRITVAAADQQTADDLPDLLKELEARDKELAEKAREGEVFDAGGLPLQGLAGWTRYLAAMPEGDLRAEAEEKIKEFQAQIEQTPGLFVTSTPPGAAVYLEGEKKGETPCLIAGESLEQGKTYELVLRKEGRREATSQAAFEGGHEPVSLELAALEQPLVLTTITADDQAPAPEADVEVLRIIGGIPTEMTTKQTDEAGRLELHLTVGEYLLRFDGVAYEPQEKRVTVTEEEPAPEQVTLTKAPGELAIQADRADMALVLDGEAVGKTAAPDKSLVLEDLKPGGHKLEVQVGPSEAYQMTVEVPAGRRGDVQVSVSELQTAEKTAYTALTKRLGELGEVTGGPAALLEAQQKLLEDFTAFLQQYPKGPNRQRAALQLATLAYRISNAVLHGENAQPALSEDALKRALKWAKRKEVQRDLKYMLKDAYLAQNKLDEALELIRELRKMKLPGNRLLKLRLDEAAIHARQNNDERAESLLKDLRMEHPGNAQVLYRLYQVQWEQRQAKPTKAGEAVATLDAAARAAGKASIHAEAANLLVEMSDQPQRREHREEDLNAAEHHFNRAVALAADQKMTDEKRAQLRFQRARFLLRHRGNAEKAREDLKVALRLRPRRWDYRMLMGDAFMQMRQPREAVEAYERALDAAPLSAQAEIFARRGKAHEQLREWSDADKYYRMALGRDARIAEAHGGLGRLAERLKQWREALQHFKAAHRLQPRDPDWCFAIYRTYRGLDQIAEARKWFEKATKLRENQ